MTTRTQQVINIRKGSIHLVDPHNPGHTLCGLDTSKHYAETEENATCIHCIMAVANETHVSYEDAREALQDA